MTIHLRTVTDETGDTLDNLWFCSQRCYSDSFADNPEPKPRDPDEDCVNCRDLGHACDYHSRVLSGVEKGGAYPCGSESDSLDYCAQCGAIIGNPLTDDGADALPEIIETLIGRGDDDSLSRANEIATEYSYAIPETLRDKLTRATMRGYMERGYN